MPIRPVGEEGGFVRTLGLAILLVGVALTLGCGGGGSVATPTGPGSSSVPIGVGFNIQGGTYSATLNGQTYSGAGPYQISLAPGSYEITGTYSGGSLIVAFVSTLPSGGGVQSGSARSLSGPAVVTQACGIGYAAQFGSQPFRLRFTVTTDPNSKC
jgi:hypothetical protein